MSTTATSNDTIDAKMLLRTLTAVRKGDFSVRMPVDETGIAGKIADTLNDIIELNEKLCNELERIGTGIGRNRFLGNIEVERGQGLSTRGFSHGRIGE